MLKSQFQISLHTKGHQNPQCHKPSPRPPATVGPHSQSLSLFSPPPSPLRLPTGRSPVPAQSPPQASQPPHPCREDLGTPSEQGAEGEGLDHPRGSPEGCGEDRSHPAPSCALLGVVTPTHSLGRGRGICAHHLLARRQKGGPLPRAGADTPSALAPCSLAPTFLPSSSMASGRYHIQEFWKLPCTDTQICLQPGSHTWIPHAEQASSSPAVSWELKHTISRVGRPCPARPGVVPGPLKPRLPSSSANRGGAPLPPTVRAELRAAEGAPAQLGGVADARQVTGSQAWATTPDPGCGTSPESGMERDHP